MVNPFKSLFGSRSILGVDIGTASIKIAEIAKESPKPKLINYGILKTKGYLERSNAAIQTNTLKITEKETAELLKTLVKKTKFTANAAVASIPAFSSFVVLIEMPLIPETELVKTMPFQIKQHIPLPISEVAIDWLKIGEKEDEEGKRQLVLLISIPNEVIERYKSIFKSAGLKLKALEIEGLSLIRSLNVNGDQRPTLIVDIGAYSTNILVIEGGFLRANRFTDYAGVSLTQAIANGLNISLIRAEELKKQKGLKATGGEYELSTLPQPFLDAIISEGMRVKDEYEKRDNQKIEKVILAGGGANLIGIEQYFSKQIEIPAVIANPFPQLDYPQEIALFTKELGPELAVAIGLAMKG